MPSPEVWMRMAMSLAETAGTFDEVPIGALVVFGDKIIGSGFNLKENLNDATNHAEIIALRRASANLGRWRLQDCTMFTTLEPCLMCAGALIQSRIGRVVYAATDPKAGALGSLYELNLDDRLNHSFPVEKGPLSQESSQLLKSFFKRKRRPK